ncbi:LysE/ArgO family amino acid transporter [Piscinibacter terrae]|uniref:Amino acid transporter n=1 Tax=Piscinibacter terrae TaxID=2496871 RepID=A0A3N7HS20_9BURK|nr:LysE/ArgO family amino acid transporter [Albitalea terrae]RQP24006.1 amino acid transporter [Albitalea terrae]
MSTISTALIQGWLMTAGLIVAIGAQNALVLRQGLARSHVGTVVAVCTLSDWLLIAAGVFGLGSVIQSSPRVLDVFRFGGAAFLIVYGALAARRAMTPGTTSLQAAGPAASLGATVGATLALTYLNPHVYLDTVVLLGSVGAQQPDPSARGAFAVGAGLASLMWFTALGFGASASARWLRRPGVWRGLDASVALVMFIVAAQLLLKPL